MQDFAVQLPTRTRRRGVTLAVATAVVGALILSACYSANQGKLVTLLNGFRKANGKPAMTANQQAMDKAQKWAQHMANTGVVEHTGGGSALDTTGLPRFCAAAENVAVGPSIQGVHDQWVASRLHHDNMLGNYDHVGTGVVRKGDKVYAIEIFYRAC
jgi:uncharacterized protein YkwD